MEIVRVLCADPASAFDGTHTPKETTTTGKGKTKQTTITPHYDPDWHLCGDTLWLHDEKWSGFGNWGLADQVTALQWVRDHIAAQYERQAGQCAGCGRTLPTRADALIGPDGHLECVDCRLTTHRAVA